MNIVYHLVFAFWYVCSLLPFRVLYALSDALFYPLYYVVRYRRRVVRRNLVESFPEKTEEEIVHIEKQFYSFFCDYIVETLKQLSLSEKEMRRRMTFSGTDDLIRDMERDDKHYTFIYLGHYWCGQIYHPLYNKAFDRLFLEMRSRYGAQCIPMKETLRKILEMRRRSNHVVVGFISDQAPKWNSIHHFTPFLHHDTPVFIGTEKLGRKLDAVIYFADVTRPRRGYYHCHLYRMVDDVEAVPEYQVTDVYMQHLEQMIRRAPQYWLWSHNRWKRTRAEWEQRQADKGTN